MDVVAVEFDIHSQNFAAFKAHLASAHFKRFDAGVRDMVVNKRVRTLRRIEPAWAGDLQTVVRGTRPVTG